MRERTAMLAYDSGQIEIAVVKGVWPFVGSKALECQRRYPFVSFSTDCCALATTK